MGAEERMVMIHGDMWKVTDIIETVQECRKTAWTRQAWKRGPALVHRGGGRVSFYSGQAFDPGRIDLVPDGWSHDHCLICWFEICDLDGYRDAFTDGQGGWICAECHEQFIRLDAAGAEE